MKFRLKATSNPLFADEVIVGTMVKARKVGNDVRKDGYIRIGFIDMTKNKYFQR